MLLTMGQDAKPKMPFTTRIVALFCRENIPLPLISGASPVHHIIIIIIIIIIITFLLIYVFYACIGLDGFSRVTSTSFCF